MAKSRYQLLAGTIAVGIATVFAAGIAAPVDAAPSPGTQAMATSAVITSATQSAGGGLSCSALRKNLRAYSQRYERQGIHQISCMASSPVTASPRTERTRTSIPSGKGTRGAKIAFCSVLPGGTWDLTRTIACLKSELIYTVIDLDTGEIIGTAEFTATQEIDANAANTRWSESDTLKLDNEEEAAAGLSASWTTDCSAPCSPGSASPWSGSEPIAVGQTLSGTTNFADTTLRRRAPGPHLMNHSYAVDITQPAVIPGGPATWKSPGLRCDAVLRTVPFGCVFPDVTPQFTVPISQYGAAAAFIQWAQVNLSGHWGDPALGGLPLHRLGIERQRRRNQDIICRRSFQHQPAIFEDSCDEFPFAASMESGAQHGVTNGSQCAQVEAVRDPTVPATAPLAQQWPSVRVIPPFNRTALCARGHIPNTLNNGVGREGLAIFTGLVRLLPADAYTVLVTP